MVLRNERLEEGYKRTCLRCEETKSLKDTESSLSSLVLQAIYKCKGLSMKISNIG